MKKITLFLMLAALSATAMLHAAEAGEDDFTTLSFTCSTASTLAAQMKSEMIEQVESLTVAGYLGKEDISTIDQCSRLKWLDLTNVYTTTIERHLEAGWLYSHIEKDAFRHTAIETLFLPKNILSFALQSLSLFRWDKDCGRPAADEGVTDYAGQPHFDKTITVYVTEYFPDLYYAEPIDGYFGCPMEFHLAEGNDMYIEEDGVIYTKDKNTLLKVNRLYGKTAKECTFDVEQIDRHAFTYALWDADSQVITFSKRLSDIKKRAFTYPATPYITNQEEEETKKEGVIRLLGWTPPFCEFVLAQRLAYAGPIFYYDDDIDDKYFTPCKIIVPSKVRYYAAEPSTTLTWEPFIIDDYDYGLLCGTMTPDDKEEFYSKLDPYAPRIEEVGRKIGQKEANCEWSANAGCVFGHDFNGGPAYPNLVVNVTKTKNSVPLTFVNPETGEEEKVTFKYYGTSDFGWEVIGYDTEGKELFTGTFGRGSTSFGRRWPEELPGDYFEWERGKSPVPNGSVALRIKGNGTFGLTGALGETEKKDLYFTVSFLTGVEPTELQPADDAPTYDLQGRPVTTPSKGIYIKSGKKVLIK